MRLTRVNTICQSIPAKAKRPIRNTYIKSLTLVSDKFKFILNSVPKTGRSSWTYILWNNSLANNQAEERTQESVVKNLYKMDVIRRYGIKSLSEYRSFNYNDNPDIFNTYYAVLTVRHPFSRLESAFLDKMNKQYYMKKYGIRILNLFRKKTEKNKELFKTGAGVTFEEYLKFIISYPTMDEHWASLLGQGFPCSVNYRFDLFCYLNIKITKYIMQQCF